jgi:Rrf2 family iron-sulfur cluster assembly transcriptional regulator
MKVSKASAYALHALMYMVRHATELPVVASTMAKAEGIPPAYLAKVFQRLVKAGFVKSVKGRRKGYVFAMPPEEISLLEMLEAVEGKALFSDCFMRHCKCEGTPDNCYIYAQWVSSTRKMNRLLEDTNLVTAAWNHPEHRFNSPPKPVEQSGRAERLKSKDRS